MKREAPRQPAMTYSRRDNKGLAPNKKLLDSIWMHTGNNKIYRIMGFIWDCDEDVWKIRYKPLYTEPGDNIEYTRSILNFEGMRGELPRFVRVTRESFDEEQME